ncbi:hypothetical protein [Enterococcus sp. CWB-B31]|uniref:hypothetical protein n=1 Tax=Enterococcus sp. CWB-B31 TaxID=2885159 RepID=UPI001E59D8D7|nr:hypothetical protein [Enterococcus sp. CWB-B31]MCB5955086.1 hypothetical protein [Enterococcus sp. CWB-B31]
MKELTVKQNEKIVGGYHWKCKNNYHSSWAGNTFVSAYHIFFGTANAAMNEHRRTYGHTNTWVA